MAKNLQEQNDHILDVKISSVSSNFPKKIENIFFNQSHTKNPTKLTFRVKKLSNRNVMKRHQKLKFYQESL